MRAVDTVVKNAEFSSTRKMIQALTVAKRESSLFAGDANGQPGTIVFHRIFGPLRQTSISLYTTGSTTSTNDVTTALPPDHEGNGHST